MERKHITVIRPKNIWFIGFSKKQTFEHYILFFNFLIFSSNNHINLNCWNSVCADIWGEGLWSSFLMFSLFIYTLSSGIDLKSTVSILKSYTAILIFKLGLICASFAKRFLSNIEVFLHQGHSTTTALLFSVSFMTFNKLL